MDSLECDVSQVIYWAGGLNASAPAQNKAQQWDDNTRLYTAWDTSGNQTTQRAYTTQENTDANARQAVITDDANRASLQTKATNAIATNNNFLAIASPTNAQAVAQVQLLTRENTAIIRLLLGLLDSTAGT